ncbi:Hypothetical predicted protein [Mytilus galloprovincialis]|uniref:Endonuclease/exonuclease/phosphatase domain-containing protein n=1 Tax=Mytilus galloprovincialis TaxID=29158 RepID=A0A8B6GLW4_MYTGA|nr:Hypothetical predicted protein [Mytilus galloprovincialis]
MLNLNCCGLVRKSQYPEFIKLISDHDIICLTETKTDNFDNIHIPEYTFKFKNRKSHSRVKSGGITFGYKNEIAKYIHISLKTKSSLVLWAKISADFLQTDEDLVIGNVYIPPENSLYKITDALNELEQELLKLSVNYKFIMLVGDFNSRTASDIDFSNIVNSKHDIVSDSDLCYDYSNTLQELNMLSIRKSKDISKNTYGNALLDICKNNNLFILNGRVNGDKEGIFTCRSSSVVDYFICSFELLDHVVNMHVDTFSSLYSDVHCPLTLLLKFKIEQNTDVTEAENNDVTSGSENIKFKKWDNEKKQDFIENIDVNKIAELENELLFLHSSVMSQNSVNKLSEHINEILLESAEKVLEVHYL